MKVLIIEDDSIAVKNINTIFKKFSITSDHGINGEEGLEFLESYTYDVILLDIGLPDMSGFEVLKKLRHNKIQTPVLILSGLNDSTDKIKGLTEGADDYLSKPFNQEELMARINALVRRSKGYAHSVITVDALTINLDTKQVLLGKKTLSLTNKEYTILEILALRLDKLVHKNFLLDQLYSGMDEPTGKIIDVFVCKLRKKIKNLSGKNYIGTVWGQGYILQDPSKML